MHEGPRHLAVFIYGLTGGGAQRRTMTLASEFAERGHRVGQSGCIGENGRFAYLETEAHPGTVIELSEISGAKGRFFRHIEECARAWDGSDPIRRF